MGRIALCCRTLQLCCKNSRQVDSGAHSFVQAHSFAITLVPLATSTIQPHQPLKKSMTNIGSSIFFAKCAILWELISSGILPVHLWCRTLDRSIVALIHLSKHIHSLLRSLLSLRVLFNLQPLKQSMTDISVLSLTENTLKLSLP